MLTKNRFFKSNLIKKKEKLLLTIKQDTFSPNLQALTFKNDQNTFSPKLEIFSDKNNRFLSDICHWIFWTSPMLKSVKFINSTSQLMMLPQYIFKVNLKNSPQKNSSCGWCFKKQNPNFTFQKSKNSQRSVICNFLSFNIYNK